MTHAQLQLLKLTAKYLIMDADEDGRQLDDLQDALYQVEKEERAST